MFDKLTFKKCAKNLIILCMLIGCFVFLPKNVLAQVQGSDYVGLKPMEQSGLNTDLDIRVIIANIIRIILGFLGTVAVIIFLYGGFMYMTSKGDPEKINKAKDILRDAIIGIIIIMSAYGIASFLIRAILGATGTGDFGGGQYSSGTLPSGVMGEAIESHYPPRDAKDIPRNTKIIVSFRVPINTNTIIDNRGTPTDLNDDIITKNIEIIRVENSEKLLPEKVNVRSTGDGKTFVFDPVDYLGNPVTNTLYEVRLTNGIENINEESVFGSVSAYSWKFEVSTVLDLTPPKVLSVIPRRSDPPLTYARNIVVQITFDEPVDPIAVSGLVDTSENDDTQLTGKSFTNAGVFVEDNGAKHYVEGTFSISNMYRTIEFLSNVNCGDNVKNSCGDEVFCLPGNKLIGVEALAATLSESPPEAKFPDGVGYYDGVVDVAGNSLDGNANEKAEGPGRDKDNFYWTFNTNNKVILTPPKIDEVYPSPFSVMVPLDSNIWAQFNRGLFARYLNKDNVWINEIFFQAGYQAGVSYKENNKVTVFTGSMDEIGALCKQKDCIDIGFSYIEHTENLRVDAVYTPEMRSGIKDFYQNCFIPCEGPGTELKDEKIKDDSRRTDLLFIKRAIEEYRAKKGTYSLTEVGVNGSGTGILSVKGGKENLSIFDLLVRETNLANTKDDLSLADGDNGAGYRYFACGNGGSYSLSARLKYPKAAQTDKEIAGDQDIAKSACNGIENVTTHNQNYSVSNFNSLDPRSELSGRDNLRRADLKAIKASIDKYVGVEGSLPKDEGYCAVVSELKDLIGPVNTEQSIGRGIKPYVYINFGKTYAVISELEYAGSNVTDYETIEIRKQGKFEKCPEATLGLYQYCVGSCDEIPKYTSGSERALSDMQVLKKAFDNLDTWPGNLDSKLCDGIAEVAVKDFGGVTSGGQKVDEAFLYDPWSESYIFDASYEFKKEFQDRTDTATGRVLMSKGVDKQKDTNDDVYLVLCEVETK